MRANKIQLGRLRGNDLYKTIKHLKFNNKPKNLDRYVSSLHLLSEPLKVPNFNKLKENYDELVRIEAEILIKNLAEANKHGAIT
jgi:hypothetical protein